MRKTHVICIICQLLQFYFNHTEAIIAESLLLIVQVFCYMGTILFIQLNIANSLVSDWHMSGRQQALFWLTVEVLTLYLYIISAAIYLAKISIRGLRGVTTLESKRERFKYDAIEYYKLDMDWFAFIFIMFAIDTITYCMVSFKILADTKDGTFAQHGTIGTSVTEVSLLEAIICARIFQFLFIGDLRDIY
jgi:hypothetical protein